MKNRRTLLIIAVLLAVGTGILTLRYLSSLNQQAAPPVVETRSIVIASHDIPTRSKITADMLTKTTRPVSDVDPQALTDPKQAEGSIALVAMPLGTTVTSVKVGRPADLGITARLKPGMRAVSIPVDRVKAVSNLIEPGDHVDVMAAVNRGPGVPPKSFTIIRGAVVLALNSQLDVGGASPSPADAAGPATITLGVTPQQANLLMVADINTTLRLALRSPQEPVRAFAAEKLVFADLGSAQAAPANVPVPSNPVSAPVPVPGFTQPPLASAVTVIDGDKVVVGVH